ncbi:hypothetical protein NC653_036992 [Populus alba x Populus x berolinensis]|uniref:Uncharacterized protein n=1 Tax=Populus alba x Populus x berolinensis TaxID=444605 RepID=A0AAD6LL80_9ROSI|nr:hypothetical protein NC653_036992 [Populus alba x Populus x berolinensis]
MGIFHRPERVLSFLLKCLGELLVSFDVNNPLIASSENTVSRLRDTGRTCKAAEFLKPLKMVHTGSN